MNQLNNRINDRQPINLNIDPLQQHEMQWVRFWARNRSIISMLGREKLSRQERCENDN